MAPSTIERSGKQTVDLLAQWLGEAQGKPLFVWLHLFDAHGPYAPPPPIAAAYVEPGMGAEDFALFAEEVPGVLFRLGTGNRVKGLNASLHNSLFDVDEESILIGTKIMSWFAVSFLSSKGEG